VLLTGFEPFGGSTLNPAWEAARTLDGLALAEDVRVTAVQLPVVWETAGARLRAAIEQHQPLMVVCVGRGGEQIALERVARNTAGAKLDNAGQMPAAEVIRADGPQEYQTRFDLEALQAGLSAAGIPAVISTDAGNYLCNWTYYHCLDWLSAADPDIPALFVHVPPVGEAEALDKAKLDQIIDCLKIVLADCWKQHAGWSA